MAIAPTGAAGFGRRGSDIDIARAAAVAGIPYTLSSTATASIEQIANAAPARHWFQAYILRNKPFLHGLIDRALAADYEALMITVDLPVGGKRERDFRNDFSIPFRFTAKNLLDFATCPVWAFDMLMKGLPVMENLIGLDTKAIDAAAIASSVGRNYDPAFDWDALQVLRDRWPRKLIIKGILNPRVRCGWRRWAAMRWWCRTMAVVSSMAHRLRSMHCLQLLQRWMDASRSCSTVAFGAAAISSRHWPLVPMACCWAALRCSVRRQQVSLVRRVR